MKRASGLSSPNVRMTLHLPQYIHVSRHFRKLQFIRGEPVGFEFQLGLGTDQR
jgi:hypothetical protein